MRSSAVVVVPWHDADQRSRFMEAWRIHGDESYVVLQQDVQREGCARTKNRGIAAARARGANVIVVLDDDCLPTEETCSLELLIAGHLHALKPQQVPAIRRVTVPPSRGTPYRTHDILRPVAASMGFWTDVGDYDALATLVAGTPPMTFDQGVIWGEYFALSGMNLAFRVEEWFPWCQFVEVPRFDDIWMGWLWQKEAYRRGACFNLAGPLVRHTRQSNVWRNLADEVRHLERNETLWRDIALSSADDYASLRRLIPVP